MSAESTNLYFPGPLPSGNKSQQNSSKHVLHQYAKAAEASSKVTPVPDSPGFSNNLSNGAHHASPMEKAHHAMCDFAHIYQRSTVAVAQISVLVQEVKPVLQYNRRQNGVDPIRIPITKFLGEDLGLNTLIEGHILYDKALNDDKHPKTLREQQEDALKMLAVCLKAGELAQYVSEFHGQLQAIISPSLVSEMEGPTQEGPDQWLGNNI